MGLLIFFNMLIYSSYEMTTSFANVTRFTSCTNNCKLEKTLRNRVFGNGVFDREIIVYCK